MCAEQNSNAVKKCHIVKIIVYLEMSRTIESIFYITIRTTFMHHQQFRYLKTKMSIQTDDLRFGALKLPELCHILFVLFLL